MFLVDIFPYSFLILPPPTLCCCCLGQPDRKRNRTTRSLVPTTPRVHPKILSLILGPLPILGPKTTFPTFLLFHLLLRNVNFSIKRKESSSRKNFNFSTPTFKLISTSLQPNPRLSGVIPHSQCWPLNVGSGTPLSFCYPNLCFLDQPIFLTPYSRLYSSLRSIHHSQASP